MPRLNPTTCCGIRELAEIYTNSPQTCIRSIKNDWRQHALYIFFSVISANYKYGRALADYIYKHKLGTVYALPPDRNPNSGNRLHVFWWKIDVNALSYHTPKD